MGKALLHDLGQSLSFGRLSLLGKVLWPMLLTASDDQGRGLAEPDAIRWQVCPNVDELTINNIPEIVAEIAEQGMIHRYMDERGRHLYQIVRWWDYQQLAWAQPSKYIAPDGWVDRVRRQVGGTIEKVNWDVAGGFCDGSELRGVYVEPTLIPTDAITQYNTIQNNPIEDNLTESNDSLVVCETTKALTAQQLYQNVRDVWIELFPDKRTPRPTNKTLRGKVVTRMKDAHFREHWHDALIRASKSTFIDQSGWFDLDWFLKNDSNYEKCLNGKYDNTNGRDPPKEKGLMEQRAEMLRRYGYSDD